MDRTAVDDAQLRTLAAEGFSPTEIATRLRIPRSTVRDRLKKLDLASSPDTPIPVSTEGLPPVYNDMLITMISDLQELVTWWQERKATLHQQAMPAASPSAPPSMSNGAGLTPSDVRLTSIT